MRQMIFPPFHFFLCAIISVGALLGPSNVRAQDNVLTEQLSGYWRLVSYTYSSNNRTYTTPDEMEAVAHFEGGRYHVDFLAYIPTGNAKRGRRAWEEGTFSVDGNMILLDGHRASHNAELGHEVLSAVVIDGDQLRFTSNDGAIHEVWSRFLQ